MSLPGQFEAPAATLEEAIRKALSLYPAGEGLRDVAPSEVRRWQFQMGLIASYTPPGGKVMDVGGGIGAFSPALALYGYRTTLVDDFGDDINSCFPTSEVGVHRRVGVEVVSVDASSDKFQPEPGSFDAITCVDSIEHWHRSPKASLHKMVAALKPGGLLMIGMPNCVNLRKRITVPLGRGKWSPMEHWYETPVFRSHVREPDVEDMLYIARDLGLENAKVIGRNWAGMAAGSPLARAVARLIDPVLRLKPSLCSDLYLVGTRPANASAAPASGSTVQHDPPR